MMKLCTRREWKNNSPGTIKHCQEEEQLGGERAGLAVKHSLQDYEDHKGSDHSLRPIGLSLCLILMKLFR